MFKKIVLFLPLTVLLFTVIPPLPAFAAQTACSWNINSSGGWTEPANWSCGVVPNGPEYDVTICRATASGAITVTATTSITLGRLIMGTPGGSNTSCNSLGHTLDVNGVGITLDDSDGWAGGGDLLLGARGIINAGTGTWAVDGDIEINGGSAGATAAPRIVGETSTFTLTNGAQQLNSSGTLNTSHTFYNLSLAPSGATTTIGGSVVKVSNVFTLSGGGVAASSSAPTVTLSATSEATPFVKSTSYVEPVELTFSACANPARNIPGGTYTALTVNPQTGACNNATSTLTGNVTISGTLTLNGTGSNSNVHTLDTGGYDFTVTGVSTLGHGIVSTYFPSRLYITGASTVTLASTTANFACTSCDTPNTEGGIWITNGNTLNITGDLDFADYYAAAAGVTIPLYAGTGTIQMTATNSPQFAYTPSGDFYNLTINSTGPTNSNTVNVYGNVENNLILTDGVLQIDANTRFSVGGNLTVNGSGASISQGSETTTTFVFDGTTTYTDSTGAFDLGNIYIASSTAVATFTLGSTASSTSVHVGTGEVLALGSNTLNLTNTSATTTPLVLVGTLTPGTGTVKYKGTSSTIAPTLYYNLNTENAGKLYTIAASSTVTNNLTNTAGTILLSAGTTTVIGNIANSDTVRESTGVLSKAATSLSLDDTAYDIGDTMTLTLIDQDGNLVGTSTQTLAGITATISSGADSETITLTETGIATFTFSGTLPIANATASANDGTLQVSSSGTITVAYIDPQDYTDTSASDTASITVSSGGGGGGSSSSSSTSGVVLLAPYNPEATVGTQTPTQPPATESGADPLASIRAQITPIIAMLLIGPIQVNTTNTQNRILQFLLAGDKTIYPEGLITGYYGPLTKSAVQRFQLQYGVTTTTDPYYGYAGPLTRAKIKEVLGK